MTRSAHAFALNYAQKAALDDFAPVLLNYRQSLVEGYTNYLSGRIEEEDVLHTLACIEAFAKAFGIGLPDVQVSWARDPEARR